MTLSRIALLTAAAGFAGFGVASTVSPQRTLGAAGIRTHNSRARTELRAMYGGMEMGLGAFFALAAFKPGWQRPALAAQAMGLGALAATRVGGIFGDRPHGKLMPALAVAEASAAATAAVALARKSEMVGKIRRAA